MLPLDALHASLRRRVPPPLRTRYRRLRRWAQHKARVRQIPLERVLLGGEHVGEGGEHVGEHVYSAGQWADLVGDPRRASLPLYESPHVQLLQRYSRDGPAILDLAALRATSYYRNALDCIRYSGHYFGQSTEAGIQAQAAAFCQLYERMRRGDPTEVSFPSPYGHSVRGTLPRVCATWTPNTYQVLDGYHRLAIAWVLGQRHASVVVAGEQPTELQRLALRVSVTQSRRELYQPVSALDFDTSWPLVRRCEDRWAMMVAFLDRMGLDLSRSSMIDLACSYGWFVTEFARRGAQALGVEAEADALRIGRIAYGLSPAQQVHGHIQWFLECTKMRCDVVLLLSVLHHLVLRPSRYSPEALLRQVDALTGSVLFLDTGQAHEQWYRTALRGWDEHYIAQFIKQHTTFSEVIPLGTDNDDRGYYAKNYRRTLFACVR